MFLLNFFGFEIVLKNYYFVVSHFPNFFHPCVFFAQPCPDDLIPEVFEYRIVEAPVKPKALKDFHCSGIRFCCSRFFKLQINSFKQLPVD